MRLLLCLVLVQLGVGQTINATGTFDFEAAASWNEQVIPSASASMFTQVAIEGGANVYLSAGALFTIFAPLRIGAAATANAALDATTQLTLISRGFLTSGLVFNRGKIVMNGTASFTCGGDVTLDIDAMRSIEGGRFALAAALPLGPKRKISVNAGSLWFTGVKLDCNDNEIWVATGASVQFAGQCAVDSAVALRGAGEAWIAATAELAANAALTIQNTKTHVKGNLTVAASQAVTVSGELVVYTGARVHRTAAQAQAHVSVEAQATLRFSAEAMAAAKASVQGGLVRVKNGGKCIVDAAVGILASDVTFESNAILGLNFGADRSSFAAATLSGTLTIAAGATLQLNGPEPTAKVVLVTAASIAGKFDQVSVNGVLLASASASTGRRLLAGTVIYNNNTIEYQPGDASPASKAQCLFALLAPIALFW